MDEEPAAAASGLPTFPDDVHVLRSLVEGAAGATGKEFFEGLARWIASATGTRFAFVAEFLPPHGARTLGFWVRDHLEGSVEWDLRGSPSEGVLSGDVCHHPSRVTELFPADRTCVQIGVESYLGMPLRHPEGETLGLLAVFDDRPMPVEPKRLDVLRIFASRAAAELHRMRTERELVEQVRSYRDLYEEAPIAYIYEDLESRFVRANRAACRLLGLEPEEVVGAYGKSFLAPTPDTIQKIERALTAMKSERAEFSWVELELRRKDNGQPIWVHWWSKPEPDGKHTRTMLVDITDRVLMAREKARLEQQNVYLQEEIKAAHNFEEIVGGSAALTRVLDSVRSVAPTDATVLIMGETGTGKELIARALHSASRRRDKPLIKVNCAALPVGLVESELFGHERGAFSGAIARRTGRFELAHGGTIFLDEIGELPPEAQVKLLRVLQEREFERVGGNTPIRTDVRLIAATNRSLQRAVADGRFREDLYYRLDVFPITVPPLRERREDITLLAHFMVEKLSAQIGKKLRGVSSATLGRLVGYHWPGNVRELENILERAVILATGEMVEVPAEMLPSPAATQAGAETARETPVAGLRAMEREHILSALEKANWVIEGGKGAARMLAMHPNTLRSRMKKLRIDRPGRPGSRIPPESTT